MTGVDMPKLTEQCLAIVREHCADIGDAVLILKAMAVALSIEGPGVRGDHECIPHGAASVMLTASTIGAIEMGVTREQLLSDVASGVDYYKPRLEARAAASVLCNAPGGAA